MMQVRDLSFWQLFKAFSLMNLILPMRKWRNDLQVVKCDRVRYSFQVNYKIVYMG